MKKKYFLPQLFFLFSAFFFVLSNPVKIFAANTIIGSNPSLGSYQVGTPFTTEIFINGHGDLFNAAQATVAVSSNLSIKDITIGDCNFSFITTPTITNPSFLGVILGGSSKNCTLYTLTLLPISPGKGIITISNASVKSYITAQNTLLLSQNGNFTLNPSASGVTIAPDIITQESQAIDQNSPYSVTVRAVNNENNPIGGITVLLDPVQAIAPSMQKKTSVVTEIPTVPSVTESSEQTAVTDTKGIAKFFNVPKGVHTVVIANNTAPLNKEIFNVAGTNHTLTLGIKVKAQGKKASANPIILISIFIFAICTLGFFLLRHLFARMNLIKKNQSISQN